LEGRTAGPDGNLWYTQYSGDVIGRVTTAGVITEFAVPSTSTDWGIHAGSDGALWFRERDSGKMGRSTVSGSITEFPANTGQGLFPGDVTLGPDGNIWFASGNSYVGIMTPAGVVSYVTTPGQTNGITRGPDGNIWATDDRGELERITPVTHVVTSFVVPGASGFLDGITTGPDGNLWFADGFNNLVGKSTTGGSVTTYPNSGGWDYITSGPDGALWMSDGIGGIGHVTTSGVVTTVSTCSGTIGSAIVAGPDGNMWFTGASSGVLAIGVINPGAANPLAIATASPLPDGTVNVAYNQTITATGGIQPYTWSIAAGALPPGLSLNPATGAITGTPTAAGPFSFDVTVTDSAVPTPATATRTFSLTINDITITTASPLPPGTTGAAYSITFAAVGGTPPYAWSISAGALPPGLTLDPVTGQLSGSPTAPGTFNFTVTATDTGALTGSKAFTLVVSNPPPLTITTASPLPNGLVQQPYSQTITATGGIPPYTWSISAGALPPGLALDAVTGTISGTPTAAGAYSFTVDLTDSAGTPVTASKAFTLVVASPPPLAITTASPLPNGLVQQPYSQTITATGGIPPYTWSISAGALPPGLALDAVTGTISGTPTASGVFNFTVDVTDSAGTPATASKAFTLTIAIPNPFPKMTVSKTHTGSFTVGGTGVFTLLVENLGTGPTTGTTTVIDSMPNGLFFLSAAGTGWSCAGGGSAVICTYAAVIPVGGSTSLTLTVAVGIDAVPRATNTATVSTPGNVPVVEQTDFDTVTVVNPGPDVSLTKSHSGTLVVGSPVTYLLQAANVGSGPTTGDLTLLDPLPNGLTYVSADGEGWNCGADGQLVTCVFSGVLGPGETTAVTLTTLVGPAAAPSVLNAASVTGGGDVDLSNNIARDTAFVETLGQIPDLWVLGATHAAGANGSQFQTDIFTLNQAAFEVDAELDFLPADGSAPLIADFPIAGGGAVRSDGDVVTSLFGSVGAGTLLLRIPAGLPAGTIAMEAHTYNVTPLGTYGLVFPARVAADGLAADDRTGELFNQLSADGYRTNMAYFAPFATSGTLRLLDSAGAELGSRAFTAAAGQSSQIDDVFAFFGVSPQGGTVTRIETDGSGVLLAAGAIVDSTSGPDATNDPTPSLPFVGRSTSPIVYLPAAHLPGAYGAQFATDVAVRNSASSPAVTLFLDWYPTGDPGGATGAAHVSRIVAPGETVVFADVLAEEFGVTLGSGILAVAPAEGLEVFSHTYDISAGGTAGFGLAGLPVEDGIVPGAPRVFYGVTSGPRETAPARANLLLFDSGSTDAVVEARLVSADGTSAARGTYIVPAFGSLPVNDVIGSVLAASGCGTECADFQGGSLTLSVDDGGPVYAFLGEVDNGTNDPAALPSVPKVP